MRQSKALVQELKRVLKESKVTYKDVAAHLELSEASVKRMFATSNLSLNRLESILELAKMEISEFVERAAAKRTYLSELTPEQEEALTENPELLIVAFLVLNRWSYEEIQESYEFTEQRMQSLLIKLDRLQIIELLPFNRYRLLTARNFSWRKDGPVQQFFMNKIQKEFFDSRFSEAGDKLRFVAGRLSPDGIRQMHRAINKLSIKFDELSEQDSKLPTNETYGCSAVFALRPMEYSMFTQYSKNYPEKLSPITGDID